MTAWTIGQTDRFRAAVCGAPVFDLESFYGSSDIGHVFGELQSGGPPHELREYYAAHSPSTFAHQTRTPTLIFHGEADDRCPIGQGEQMFVALTKAGCDVEFVRYPGASHLFQATGYPAHRADALTRVLGWFKEHLGEPV
jgi:dipeptidyl aminopeptidase/acylaminoacyl peptidase